MRLLTFLICIHVAINLDSASSRNKLNEYILHYETLDYDRSISTSQHDRHRRSVSQDFIHIEFDSHGKTFRMKLWRDSSVFNRDVKFVSDDGHPLDISHLSHLYGGLLTDDPTSHVYGSIIDGIFDGKIHTKDGIFYVERSSKYQNQLRNQLDAVHSIIYREEDVVDPYVNQRSGHVPGCAVTDQFTETSRMQPVERPAENALNSRMAVSPTDTTTNTTRDTARYEALDVERSFDNSWSWYNHNQETENNIYARTKRSIHRRQRIVDRAEDIGSCIISITVDPYMYRHFFNANFRSVAMARREILILIATHVAAANVMFQGTTFDGKYVHRFGTFEIGKVKFINFESCEKNYTGRPHPYCDHFDAAGLLDLHSEYDHDAFCLSYVFTCRDFDRGILGLAWVASPGNIPGGICTRRRSGVFHKKPTVKGSLNTGIVTFVNYHVRVPQKVTEVTFAHELGHNFGSPHDFPRHCKGTLLDGNYIMYQSATSGKKRNNRLFSQCSNKNISLILDAMKEGTRYNCFRKKPRGVCGNKVVEQSEECDCGMDDDDCNEKCCYPQYIEPYLKSNPRAKPCTLKLGAECSPSTGPCCSKSCNFVPKNSYKQCQRATECAYASSCDGLNATCPKPRPKIDGLGCANNNRVCVDGECIGSICLKYNMEECFLTSDRYQDISKLCEVACQKGNDNSTCKGTSDTPHLFKTPVMLEKGEPCDDYRGFCDESAKCRQVDSRGPLLIIFNRLFTREYWHNVGIWLAKYWWVVVLICVFLIILAGLLIMYCSLRGSPSDFFKPVITSFFQTFHYPNSTLGRRRPRSSMEIPPLSSLEPLPPPQENQTTPPLTEPA